MVKTRELGVLVVARKFNFLGLVASGLIAFLTWSAVPAHALQTVTVSCATSSAPSLTADPGERIRVVVNGNCTQFSISRLGYQSIVVDIGPGQETLPRDSSAGMDNFYRNSLAISMADVILPFGSFGSITMTVSIYPNPVVATITVMASGGSSGGTSDSSAPPPVLQQFVRPLNASCDEAAGENLNWAGVRAGGWGHSWAQWPNDGRGGAVCTREVFLSGESGVWSTR